MSRLSDGEKEFLSSQMELGPEPASAKPRPGQARPVEDANVIDARGVTPPLPLLRAHRALRAMPPGQVLKVITSASPQSMAEFQALVKFVVGYELVSQEQRGDHVVHVLRRRA
jgi:tRNA 2-thiouridine synthesizing protein A